MKYKTSLFNKALIKDDWHRLWQMEVLYSLILVLNMALGLRKEYLFGYLRAAVSVTETFLARQARIIPYFAVFIGVALALVLFSYLMKAQSVNLMHAFPMKRETHFASHILAGIEFFTVGNFMATLLMVFVELAYKGVDLKNTVIWFITIELSCLFFFALAVVAAVLTGWIIALPGIYVFLNVFAISVTGLLQLIAGYFYYGFDNVTIPKGIQWLTPFYEMSIDYSSDFQFYEDYTNYSFGERMLPTALIYGAVGVVLLALSLLMYKKRNSESAGDISAFSKLEPIGKFVISFIVALGFGTLAFDLVSVENKSMWPLLIFSLIGGVLSVTGCDMLVKKSARVFNWKTATDIVIMSAILVVTLLCVHFDITGFQKRIPEENTVVSVSVTSTHLDQGAQVTDATYIAKAIEAHRQFVNRGEDLGGRYYIFLEYTFADGSTMSRCYSYDINDADALLDQLDNIFNDTQIKKANREELLNTLYTDKTVIGGSMNNWNTDTYYQLSPEEVYELGGCLLKDNEIEGNILVREYPVYCEAQLSMHLENDETLYITLCPSDENTLAWLASHNYETDIFSVNDWYAEEPIGIEE